ncbi:MAG: chorismate synthase [Planctomycetota bacterium]
MRGLEGRLTLRTAGESHGQAVVSVLEGLPRGLAIDLEAADAHLKRRQGGIGRGGRQRIEADRLRILAGVRRGRTTGAPLCLVVENRDHRIDDLSEPTRPRPGHADLAGCGRWLDRDIRSTLERASARETAARVAAGAVCAQLLALLDCEAFGFVRSLGSVALPGSIPPRPGPGAWRSWLEPWKRARESSRALTLDPAADEAMVEAVRDAAREGETLGGLVEVHALGFPPGLGSCLQWQERLDARLAAALISIPAIKGLEIGDAFRNAGVAGSQAHDPILPRDSASGWFGRASNHAGGIEGGMTNGEPVVVRAAMKPISTLRKPLPSVDLATGEAAPAGYERSDVCAVSAASVVAEAMTAYVLLDALLERVGGETVGEVLERTRAFRERAAALAAGPGGTGTGPAAFRAIGEGPESAPPSRTGA